VGAFFVGAVFLVGLADNASASPSCTPEVVRDGSLIYTQVVDAKPIKKSPPHVKALLPKRTMGAKMYLHAKEGVTQEYLHRAALCHAASDAPPAFQGDPLRVDGEIDKIRVYSGAGKFVIAVTGKNSGVGRDIWERARALTEDVDNELAQNEYTMPSDF
jgi:hypothetical protein